MFRDALRAKDTPGATLFPLGDVPIFLENHYFRRKVQLFFFLKEHQPR